jgi:hypothetical protein
VIMRARCHSCPNEPQLTRILAAGQHIPSALHTEYLERVAEMLRGRDFGDGDVARAVALAPREIIERSRHKEARDVAAVPSAP